MKESKKCGIASVACAFLAVVSVVLGVIALNHGKIIFAVWSGANVLYGSFLAIWGWKVRKGFIRTGR